MQVLCVFVRMYVVRCALCVVLFCFVLFCLLVFFFFLKKTRLTARLKFLVLEVLFLDFGVQESVQEEFME